MSHNILRMLISFYDYLAKLKKLKAEVVQIIKLRLIVDHLKLAAIIISLTIVACSSPNEDMVAPRGKVPISSPTQTTQVGPAPTMIQVTRPEPTRSEIGRATLLPSPSPSLIIEVTATLSPTPELPPTPDPYGGLSVADLASRDYGGGSLDIIDTVESNESFTRYLITYPSDGLTIYGFMNVPNEGSKFPVAIVLHGYIAPNQYNTLAYTTRYADALAKAGYLVIHPNFRNYPPSNDGPDPFRTGYAIDVLNLIQIIRRQSEDPTGYLRRANRDQIHLFGHSMGGGIALRVVTVNNDPYLRAAVLYGSMSGDERLNYEQIREWSGGTEGEFELNATADQLFAISPINHLDRIRAAIGIHHSLEDQVVPHEWSDDLCQRLQDLQKVVECFSYDNQPHTFRGTADALFIERAVDFYENQ